MTASAATEGDLVTVRAEGPYAGLGGYVRHVDGDQVLVLFGAFEPQTFPAADVEVHRPPPPEALRKLRWEEVLADIDECLGELSPDEREELALLFRKVE